MKRPEWSRSRTARWWLAVAAVVFVLLGARVALRSFGTEATLSDGARAYASCKAPWRSARIAMPAQRFTLWVMTGGTGTRRAEGVATLGAHCRVRGRRRTGFSVVLLVGAGVLTWLALPPRRGSLRPEGAPSP